MSVAVGQLDATKKKARQRLLQPWDSALGPDTLSHCHTVTLNNKVNLHLTSHTRSVVGLQRSLSVIANLICYLFAPFLSLVPIVVIFFKFF